MKSEFSLLLIILIIYSMQAVTTSVAVDPYPTPPQHPGTYFYYIEWEGNRIPVIPRHTLINRVEYGAFKQTEWGTVYIYLPITNVDGRAKIDTTYYTSILAYIYYFKDVEDVYNVNPNDNIEVSGLTLTLYAWDYSRSWTLCSCNERDLVSLPGDPIKYFGGSVVPYLRYTNRFILTATGTLLVNVNGNNYTVTVTDYYPILFFAPSWGWWKWRIEVTAPTWLYNNTYKAPSDVIIDTSVYNNITHCYPNNIIVTVEGEDGIEYPVDYSVYKFPDPGMYVVHVSWGVHPAGNSSGKIILYCANIPGLPPHLTTNGMQMWGVGDLILTSNGELLLNESSDHPFGNNFWYAQILVKYTNLWTVSRGDMVIYSNNNVGGEYGYTGDIAYYIQLQGWGLPVYQGIATTLLGVQQYDNKYHFMVGALKYTNANITSIFNTTRTKLEDRGLLNIHCKDTVKVYTISTGYDYVTEYASTISLPEPGPDEEPGSGDGGGSPGSTGGGSGSSGGGFGFAGSYYMYIIPFLIIAVSIVALGVPGGVAVAVQTIAGLAYAGVTSVVFSVMLAIALLLYAYSKRGG